MNDPSRRSAYTAEMLLVLVVLIWSSNYPIAKYGISVLDVFVFNAIRFIVAAAFVLVFFVTRFAWSRVEPRDWSRLITVGIIANVVYQMAFIIGLKLTTAGNAAVLLSTAPLWTVFLNARIHKENIGPAVWLGMAMSLCGIALIVIGSGKKVEFGSHALIGDVVTLVAAALWALNTNLQKPLVAKYPAVQVTLVMLSVGAVGLTVAAIPTATTMDWIGVNWTYYLAAVISGALSIGVANVIWSIGVKRLGPGRTANFNNLVPVLAFVFSYFALDEQLYLIQFIGAGVTIGGVWIARR
jgi:drug/metabolite transporter (DMT)-like permease